MEEPSFAAETLIVEVAKRHKTLLAPEDPAFALVTLNELMLSRFVTLLEARLAGMESRLIQISVKQTETAKAIGEDIITAAAYVVERRLRYPHASPPPQLSPTKAGLSGEIADESIGRRRKPPLCAKTFAKWLDRNPPGRGLLRPPSR